MEASARALVAADHGPLERMFDRIVKPLDEPLSMELALAHPGRSREEDNNYAKQYRSEEYQALVRRYAAFGLTDRSSGKDSGLSGRDAEG